MAYIFRIMTRDQLLDQLIEKTSDFRVGSDDTSDLNLKNSPFSGLSLSLSLRHSSWHIISEQTFWLGNQAYQEAEISDDTVFYLQKEPLIAGVIYRRKSDLPDVHIIASKRITIGKTSDNDISFQNKRVSRQHAAISLCGGEYVVQDCDSLNGTFVNGKRVQEKVLQDGDVISIDQYKIEYEKNKLRFQNVGDDMQINGGLKAEDEDFEPDYPFFCRSPRLIIVPPAKKVEIQQPPAQESKQSISWLQVLLTPAVMIAVALVIMFTQGGSTGWLMIPMSLTGTIVAVSSYFSQKKRFRKNNELRASRYTQYLGEIEKELKDAAKDQLDAMKNAHPSCDECCTIMIKRERRLWERLLYDNDFMRLRLGSGSEKLAAEVSYPKKNVSLIDDDLEQKARDLAQRYHMVDGIPVTIDFKTSPTCGITGQRKDAITLAKNLILQAVTHHSYEDLMVVIIAPEKEVPLWSDIRWIPHVNSEQTGNLRCIACSREDKSNLIHALEDYLEQRFRAIKEENNDRDSSAMRSPFILFVLADGSFVQKSLLMKYMMQNDSRMCAAALLLFDSIDLLPKECKMIVEAKETGSFFYDRNNVSNKTMFRMERIDDALFEASMRALAPVRIEKSVETNALPTCVSFFEGMRVHTPDELPILKNWRNARIDKSLSAPIGVRANGDTYDFDIHERASGPNGLVAGMPGSGKTEMIQTWILSMACQYSPEDVSFILIDFKGSGLILPLRDLPHIAGTISDLDASIKRNLVALNHEIERREMLIKENDVNDFKEYVKLYYQNKVTEKLGFLFVIVDEYAEFRAQFSESTELMDSLMRRGRGLGIYVILMSQRIIGVASSTAEATAQFRWCLKVAGSSESREMIQIPDAASIKNPGRVFIRANEKTDVIQSFWCNAPYNPTRKSNVIPRVRIGEVLLNGERVYYEDWEKTVGFRSELTEINVAIKELNRVMNENGICASKRVWIAKLPKQVHLSKLLQVAFDGTKWSDQKANTCKPVIGLIDDPGSQSQYPLEIDFPTDGHVAVYGAPGTGKTTFLQTLIMSLALTYSPDEVSIYGMDFGGWSLMMFRDLPHVGGIVLNDDAERIEKLTGMLLQELANRKKLFAQKGIGSVASYRKDENKRMPYIVLVVDNFTPVLGLYPDLEAFFITLTQEGGSYGIYLATNTTAWNGIPFRITQNIRNSIAMQMSERNDYSQIVGRTEGMEPEKNVGRGLVRMERVLEFQTALPADGSSDRERAQNIKDIVSLMGKNWDGETAKAIPIMPECIYFSEGKENDYRIGLASDTLDWVRIGFQTSHYLTISGLRGSGKTNLLAVIARSFVHKANGELICIDVNDAMGSSLRGAATRYLGSTQEIERYMEELKDELEFRKAELKRDKDRRFTPLLLLIDNYEVFFDSVSEITVNRLEAFLKIGNHLGVFAVISVDAEALTSLSSKCESVAYNCLASAPNSVLLGGCGRDHAAIQTDIPLDQQTQELGKREGFLVINKTATRMKVMYEYKEGESAWIRSV